MSVTWDTKSEKTTTIGADEVLLIDTEDSRNQKRDQMKLLHQMLHLELQLHQLHQKLHLSE